LNAGLSTSRSYTVEAAASDLLEYGLPRRSEHTRELYRDVLASLLEKIGKRRLRDLTAGKVEAGLRSLTVDFVQSVDAVPSGARRLLVPLLATVSRDVGVPGHQIWRIDATRVECHVRRILLHHAFKRNFELLTGSRMRNPRRHNDVVR
jgi:hypothetical protein